MPSKTPRNAFVVSVVHADASSVYAVLAASDAEALKAVMQAVGVGPGDVAVVGLFSPKVVHSLKLKRKEVRRV